MRLSFAQRFFLLSLWLAAFLHTAMPAHAAGGVSLPAGAIVAYQGFECGQINGTWVAGRILNKGRFLQSTADLKSLQSKLKRTRDSAARKRLQRQIKAVKKNLTIRQTVCSQLGSGVIAPSGPQAPAPGAQSVGWNFDLTQTALVPGQEGLFFCPANGVPDAVWGSDTYTKDSSVCTAAVHAGVIHRQFGGNVRVRVKPGLQLYLGSLRNGIESLTYGNYSVSYSFINPANGSQVSSSSPLIVSWRYTPAALSAYQGSLFTFICPAHGSPGSLWGTGTYTNDSSLCTAAVHSGKITLKRGGQVRVRIAAGLSSYTGSRRNGVTSNSYGPWSGSFTLE